MKTDILIAGCGCAGLYCALNLPRDRQVTILTKSDPQSSDSFLAQGGICVLTGEDDFESYFSDTMRAGHEENDPVSVDIMIRSSQALICDLIGLGVDFAREEDGSLSLTKEGAHSQKRILFHEDVTGKEITSHLLDAVSSLSNVTILPFATLLDIICREDTCCGGIVRLGDGTLTTVDAAYTVLATGGIGGLYRHSTNFRHLTGDALAMAIRHGIALRDVNYVQIHPTTFFSGVKDEVSFLISESVRGEGALLYDKYGRRFVDELLPRDLLTQRVREQMEKDDTDYVWEDLRPIPEDVLLTHFPNIVAHCKEYGYDVRKECIPVVPAQHYFMGGIAVNHQSQTSMRQLYAVGETACNGVHGKNRLASNSLLESMIFAKRAADEISLRFPSAVRDPAFVESVPLGEYRDAEKLKETYRTLLLSRIQTQ